MISPAPAPTASPPPASLADTWAYSAWHQHHTVRPLEATDLLRADSTALGLEHPRILSAFHHHQPYHPHHRHPDRPPRHRTPYYPPPLAAPPPSAPPSPAPTPPAHVAVPAPAPVVSPPPAIFNPRLSTYVDRYPHPSRSAPDPPSPSPYPISRPIGPPFYPSAAYYPPASASAAASMPLDVSPGAHWLSRLRSCLRILLLILSGAIVCMLAHTLTIYRGNRYLELRKGEIPMVWPAHTNLAPTIILLAVAGLNFLASLAILGLSLKRSFRRPIRSRDLYRILAGCFGVILWLAAIVASLLLDNASKASLGRYSCTNQNIISNGRYQYRAVCEEQGFAVYVAVGAAFAELLTLISLAVSAVISLRKQAPLPTIQIHDAKLTSPYSPNHPKPRIS